MKCLKFISLCIVAAILISVSPRALAVDARAALLTDVSTGDALYAQAADEIIYPASTTKIMTALLVCEAVERGEIGVDDEVAMTQSAIDPLPADASTVYIQIMPGEVLTVRQYLYCAMLMSDCRSCNILAEYVGGSIDVFAEMMTARAAELGCRDTNFVNPTGYHDDDQYTTARGLYLIAAEAMTHPLFRMVVGAKKYTVPATNMNAARNLYSGNRLYGAFDVSGEGYVHGYGGSYAYDYYYKYATGIKTGYTDKAGSCLVACAEKNGMTLISVVMGAHTVLLEDGTRELQQYTETIGLFDYGFSVLEKRAAQAAAEQELEPEQEPEQGQKPEVVIPASPDEQNIMLEQTIIYVCIGCAAAIIIVGFIHIYRKRAQKK